MTPTEFGKLIKNNIHGVFLFYGEEQYLKQHYINLVKKTVCEKDTNVTLFSGEDCELSDICRSLYETASMPSMDMSTRLIILSDIEWKKVSEDDLAFLEDTFEDISSFDDCVVIVDTRPDSLDVGTSKKPSKLFLRLDKVTKSVCFEKEQAARLSVWVQKHFSALGVNADANICNSIIKRCGRDMTTLNHEITKLSAYVLSHGRNTVTLDDVHQVTIAAKEIDTFDFSNAIMNGDVDRAIFILADMKLRKEAPEMILGSIAKVYSELYTVKTLMESGMLKGEIAKKTGIHEYRVTMYMQRARLLSKNGLEKALSLCREADVKIKSSPLEKYAVLDILVVRLSMTGRIK